MAPGRDEEVAEFRALSARVAAEVATGEEMQRWRELRNQLAGPPVPPARQPAATPRAHARVARKVRVSFAPLKALTVAFSEEVSAGGLRLTVPALYEPGAELLLRIELDGPGDPEAITAIGRVVWCQRHGGHYQAGLEFVGLQPHERERLEAHAHSVSEEPTDPGPAPAPAPG